MARLLAKHSRLKLVDGLQLGGGIEERRGGDPQADCPVNVARGDEVLQALLMMRRATACNGPPPELWVILRRRRRIANGVYHWQWAN